MSIECSPIARETWVQSQVESYQRLKKWYLMPTCLTLSIIRYGSRVKWSNPGKGVTPSPTHWCSKYRKGSLLVTLDYGRLLYFFIYIHIYTYIYICIIKSCWYHGVLYVSLSVRLSLSLCVFLYLCLSVPLGLSVPIVYRSWKVFYTAANVWPVLMYVSTYRSTNLLCSRVEIHKSSSLF